MKIKIVTTSKIENKFTKNALDEYCKRLSPYCKMQFIETKNIAKEISDSSYIIHVDKNGEQVSSEDLAAKIERIRIDGNSNITVVIGSIDNINCDFKLSISKMDMHIDLISIIIYEQIYRAFRIITNSPYHK